MIKTRIAIILLLALITSQTCFAQNELQAEKIFAPAVGEKLYNLGYDLGTSDVVNPSDIEKAVIFMQAAIALDRSPGNVLPGMIKIIAGYPDSKYFELTQALLRSYVDDSADIAIAQQGIDYLIQQLNTRPKREALLEQLLLAYEDKNKWLTSDISYSLGVYATEKARTDPAIFYFMQAYQYNQYNRTAFEKFYQLAPDQVSPSMYMIFLYNSLVQNPLDIESCLQLAQYSSKLQIYQVSTQAYTYCSNLFSYLNPDQPLPAWIYIPWSLNAYNSPQNLSMSLSIAKQVRQAGTFDLILETIAAKAAQKMNDPQQAKEILTTAEQKALELLQQEKVPQLNARQQLAWFYSFAQVNPDKAISNANKAFALDPNSTTAASLLAYALVLNDQFDLAQPILETFNENPIAHLAQAKILLNKDQKSLALPILRQLIENNPSSIESHVARDILAQNNSEYLSSVSPDLIAKEYQNAAKPLSFKKPQDIFNARLNIQGSRFSYGSDINCNLSIENKSDKPLIIGDHGLIKGYIRIDAEINGDLTTDLPQLLTKRFLPSAPIKPGQSLLVPIKLVTGDLKSIFRTYPQASLDIKLTAYLDPIVDSQGNVTNRIQTVKPITVNISRQGVELSNRYLQNRLDALARGKQGQKISIITLFAGLLREQQAMANRRPLYQFLYAEWMWPLLKTALQQNAIDSDWVVKVHTMTEILSLPLDFQFTSEISQNLSDNHWPVRLIALYLLAQNQNEDFSKVLNYYAQYDNSDYVKQMAQTLGGNPQSTADSIPPTEPNSNNN